MADHREADLAPCRGTTPGAYLRFSVTFIAKDQADEKRVLGEVARRLGDVRFEF